jgi:hypothetical protein
MCSFLLVKNRRARGSAFRANVSLMDWRPVIFDMPKIKGIYRSEMND